MAKKARSKKKARTSETTTRTSPSRGAMPVAMAATETETETETTTAAASASSSAIVDVAMEDDLTEEKAAVAMTTEVDELPKMPTHPVDPRIPQQYEYDGDVYVERSCYKPYYEEIMKLMDQRKKRITVTGTPGTGKSMFMMYFFERYTQEHDDTIVILESSDKNGTLDGVMVWKQNDVKCTEVKMKDLIDETVLDAEKATKEFIFLLDGAPATLPSKKKSCVCFTSPKEAWFKLIEKDPRKAYLYMPLWTLDELCQAARTLHLRTDDGELDDETIQKRFEMFGGEARYCLHATYSDVKSQWNSIEIAIHSIRDVVQLEDLLFGSQQETTRHRLMHYVPDEIKHDVYKLVPASSLIERELLETLHKQLRREKDLLMEWLDGIPSGSSLYGFLFEARAHEILVSGCHISMQPLGCGISDIAHIDLDVTDRFSYFVKNYSLASVVDQGPYFRPDNKNFTSIDSFYLPRNGAVKPYKTMADEQHVFIDSEFGLLLFQVTTSTKHPVKGSGLASVLHKLKFEDTAKSDPSKVALIFIVPERIAGKFKKQRIEVPSDDPNAPVKDITGIGSMKADELKASGIRTVSGLREAVNRGDFSWAKTYLKNYDRTIEMSETLHRIPQYVAFLPLPRSST